MDERRGQGSGRATAKPPRPPLAVIRPFTTHVFNPITRRFARWLPGFGILAYRGRKSGRQYRTPLNVFRHEDEWIIAMKPAATGVDR